MTLLAKPAAALSMLVIGLCLLTLRDGGQRDSAAYAAPRRAAIPAPAIRTEHRQPPNCILTKS